MKDRIIQFVKDHWFFCLFLLIVLLTRGYYAMNPISDELGNTLRCMIATRCINFMESMDYMADNSDVKYQESRVNLVLEVEKFLNNYNSTLRNCTGKDYSEFLFTETEGRT